MITNELSEFKVRVLVSYFTSVYSGIKSDLFLGKYLTEMGNVVEEDQAKPSFVTRHETHDRSSFFSGTSISL